MDTPVLRRMRPNLIVALLRRAALLAVIIGLIGCASLQNISAVPDQSAIETQVAVQVTQLAAAAALQPVQAAQPTALPSYTPLPTYTSFPTFTPYPTYTPVPTFTPNYVIPTAGPVIPGSPTATLGYGGSAHPYTLRVRNMFRSTYWIGTYRPYGGNFIKPLWYVEFYPPQPTVMRIFFCRYTSFFYNHWHDIDFEYSYEDPDRNDNWDPARKWDYFNYWWDRGGLYNCNYLDFEVDQQFREVGVP